MSKRLHPQLVRRVRALAARAFLQDDLYRAFLAETFPRKAWTDPARPSTLDLSPTQADGLVRTLERLVAGGQRRDDPSQSGKPRRPGTRRYEGQGARGSREVPNLTPAQAATIARLEADLGWQNEPHRLSGWIERQTGKRTFVAALTRADATLVITGLQRLTGERPSKRASA